MRIITLIFLMSVTLIFADSKKIVVDLTSGNIKTFQSRFLSGVPGMIRYFKTKNDTVDVVVIIHGDAYKFFVQNLGNTQYKSDKELATAQEELRLRLDNFHKEYPVTFEICSVGMKKRKILPGDLYKFATPIPSAMVGLAVWQNRGYAYLPID